MPDYIKELRRQIGTMPIFLVGAGVLIVDDQGRLLLHQRRDNGAWGLPGGALEPGEKLEEAAAREVFEEVGLRCHELTLFNVYSGKELYYRYPNGDEVYNVSIDYLCKSFSGVINVDPNEGIQAQFFSIHEIPENISPPVRIIIEDFIQRVGSKS